MIRWRLGQPTLTGCLSEHDIDFLGESFESLLKKAHTDAREQIKNTVLDCDPVMIDNAIEALKRTVEANHLTHWSKKRHVEVQDITLDDLLSQDLGNLDTYEVEAYLQIWVMVDALLANREEAERNAEFSAMEHEGDSWAPPDNFADGTDEEREIYENFYRKMSG